MTRKDFLNDLYRHLYGLTQEQAEQHLTYYAEMLADRIEEGMTEDEAVENMEDVETIARRIMEEEGVPYTPPEERPVTPPSYPDASRLGGGGGTRAYQTPKKGNGRKIAQAVLWAAAIIAVISAVGRLARPHTRIYAESEAVSIDHPVKAPLADTSSWEYSSYYVEAPYEEGYEYNSGGYTFAASSFDRIDIQWAAGTVYVQSWSGDEIQLQEYAHSELSSRTAMSCQEDGGALTIRYREGTGLGSVKDDKWLTVLIPDGIMGALWIETTSADVRLNGLEVGTLNVATASGEINSSECYAQEAQLSSVSGWIYMTGGLHAETLELSSTSGDIAGDVSGGNIGVSTTSGDISLSSSDGVGKMETGTISGDVWFSVSDPAVQAILVSTTSGDVSLSLPYDIGFTLDYSTVSGELITDYFEMGRQNGKYVCNGGGCEMTVETISGDLYIY